MADHDVAEENNADRDQSVEAEEEGRVIFIALRELHSYTL